MIDPTRRLLFACDFGTAARAARDTVGALALALDAEVLVVHVQPSGLRSWFSSGLVDRERKDRLESWVARLRERGVAARSELVAGGEPASALAAIAEREGADAIAVGGQEHPGGKTRFQDRTTENVVRLSPSPVWVIKAQEGEVKLPRRLLCGVDPSEHSSKALALTADVAARLGASASVVHAVSNPDENPLGMAPAEEERVHEAHKERVRQQLETFIEEEGVPTLPSCVRWGEPADVLLSMARDEDIDLLVLGPGRTDKLRRIFLGTTAGKVLYESPISVLLVGEGTMERAREEPTDSLAAPRDR